MPTNPSKLKRRSIRLKGYDYSRAGAYFVIICVQNRECLLGEVLDEKMRLNDLGRLAEEVWHEQSERYPNIVMDAFVVMPNHVHGIIMIRETETANPAGDTRRGDVRPVPAKTQVGARLALPRSGRSKRRPYKAEKDQSGRCRKGIQEHICHQRKSPFVSIRPALLAA